MSCCWGNTLWPAKKNVRIHTRSNCRSPSLIPSPDFSSPKFRNSTQANRDKWSWRNGKRSILIKARSDVKFNDDMQKDALVWGILFCRSTGEECFAQRAFRLFLETRKNLIHLAAPHLLRLFCGRITLIIAEIQSLLKFIRTNYFKNFICQ